jgi:protein-tyrosine phosphatase
MSQTANRVATFGRGELWIGGAPPGGLQLAKDGFTSVVLCAQEFQPSAEDYPGLDILHAPFNDNGDEPKPEELNVALGASRQVAKWVRDGGKVLVTCWQGYNRSGLVTALALMRLTGMSGQSAVFKVQEKRPGALRNVHFAALIASKAVRRNVARKN